MPSLARSLTPADWLPEPFFDVLHRDHRTWSLLSFKEWLTSQRPHIHRPSLSVYGGPLGVRNLVFALSRISQNIANVDDRVELPTFIGNCLHRAGGRWNGSAARRTFDECVTILYADIRRSNDALRVTIEERSAAWEWAIEEVGTTELAEGETRDDRESGITATCGVPKSYRSIRSMLMSIYARRADAEENLEDHEVSVIMVERLCGPAIAVTPRSGASEHAPAIAQTEGL